ncbi:enolase C-terminal domain-like protein [Streptomyces bathyalis]|uniref:enolase C-terminal domain-like protein n=1 Tax=Streptomyces bathyalis TaxID=2710756 RepID=UPI0018D08E62|nr:enolase C-terminal domain-like protein [Streptomyces bathyalis]
MGTLDMALRDAAAKIAGQPLYRFLSELLGRHPSTPIALYAAGGYSYPADDNRRLADEVRQFLYAGYTHIKIKIGERPLEEDLTRIETALALLPRGDRLAVDAMHRYRPELARRVAGVLAPYRLRWLEDICDPQDFLTHAQIAEFYDPALAAGEALFSRSDAANLIRYGGLRPGRDVLLFDPAHCYGLPEYLGIVDLMETNGWPRSAFQPHGGHLFSLHVAAALGLGGSEANPRIFQPFGGFSDNATIENGTLRPPEQPGIGFESRIELHKAFHALLS